MSSGSKRKAGGGSQTREDADDFDHSGNSYQGERNGDADRDESPPSVDRSGVEGRQSRRRQRRSKRSRILNMERLEDSGGDGVGGEMVLKNPTVVDDAVRNMDAAGDGSSVVVAGPFALANGIAASHRRTPLTPPLPLPRRRNDSVHLSGNTPGMPGSLQPPRRLHEKLQAEVDSKLLSDGHDVLKTATSSSEAASPQPDDAVPFQEQEVMISVSLRAPSDDASAQRAAPPDNNGRKQGQGAAKVTGCIARSSPPTSAESTASRQNSCPEISSRRRGVFRFAAFATSVFFLTSSAAGKIWSVPLVRWWGHFPLVSWGDSSNCRGNGRSSEAIASNVTLRQLLTDQAGYHLAMAPAFFGFYGYLGALAAWEDGVDGTNIVRQVDNDRKGGVLESPRLRSAAGASAGAMTAVLLASGIPPRTAADFCSKMTLGKFADFPGVMAAFRGNKFEAIMDDFLWRHRPNSVRNTTTTAAAAAAAAAAADSRSLRMEESSIPVAVSAFDLKTLSGRILKTGSMAKAARASATFPFLFQPVPYSEEASSSSSSSSRDSLLVDGGLTDRAGIEGTRHLLLLDIPDDEDDGATAARQNDSDTHRSRGSSIRHTVINLSVGGFFGSPPGPSAFGNDKSHVRVASVSIDGLPRCAPWAMSNGPRAVEAAYRAMLAMLDAPLLLACGSRSDDDEERQYQHYELHVDARSFWPE